MAHAKKSPAHGSDQLDRGRRQGAPVRGDRAGANRSADHHPPRQAKRRRSCRPRNGRARPVRKGTLAEFLLASPLREADLDLERARDQPRDVEL